MGGAEGRGSAPLVAGAAAPPCGMGSSAPAYSQKWDECLPLAEFAYNNSYQESIRMAPFEALYGRKCRTPLNWSEAGERTFFGPDMVDEAEEQVRVI